MPMIICPRCSRKVLYAKHSGPDVQHRCDSKQSALDNDSIPKVGNWTDADGTTGTVANANFQGVARRVGGLFSHKLNVDKLNVHGKRTATHRLKRHHEHIEVN